MLLVTQRVQASVYRPQTLLSHLLRGAASHECQSFAQLLHTPVWIYDFELLLHSQNYISECICQKDERPEETTHKHKLENWTSGHFHRKWDWMARVVILAVVPKAREAHLKRDCGPLCQWDSIFLIHIPGTTYPLVKKKKKKRLNGERKTNLVESSQSKGVASRIWCL